MNQVSIRAEVKEKIAQVDEKIDPLAEHMLNNLPTREEINVKLEQKADKKDVHKWEEKMDTLLNGMDKQAQQFDIICTEQTAFIMNSTGLKNGLRS